MKLRIAASALCLVFVASAAADLVTASEMPVSPPVSLIAPFDQTQGRIASDGDGFLAVWVDRSKFDDDDVLAMPLSAEGVPAGDLAMSIAATDEAELHPLVAWNGERYLVVWTDVHGIYSRLVGRDRTVSDRVLISGGFARAQMAFNGRVFLLAWRTSDLNFHFVVLDRSGVPVRYFDTFVPKGPQAHAVVAIGETFYLVSSASDFNAAPGPLGFPSDVGITEIAENGTIGTRKVLAPATTPVFDLNAAATATDLLIGWSTAIGIPGGTIRTARFVPGGEVALETIPAEGEFLYDVLAKGNDYWLFYGNDSIKRVRAGMNASTDVVSSSPPSSFNDVATNGNAVVAVERTFGQFFENDLYARNVLTVSAAPLALAPRHQTAPDVAQILGQRMVVWNENNAIYANGLLLDTATPSSAPRVAAGAQEFLVIWRDGTDIAGIRLNRHGVRTDATSFGIVSGVYGETDPAVAWDGSGWVVVYARGVSSPRGLRTTMYAVRISSAGSVSTELELSNESANEYPAVAAGGGHALVVWRNGPFLQGATLSEGGTVMPVVTVVPHLTGAGQPSVAWNGSRYLVAAQVNGQTGPEVQWYLVTPDATVTVPPVVFPEVAASASATDVTLLGNRFLVTWTDGDALLAGAVTSDGRMTDGPALIAPQVTSFAASHGTVVYARNIDHPSRGVTRVFTKEVQVHGGLRRRAVR